MHYRIFCFTFHLTSFTLKTNLPVLPEQKPSNSYSQTALLFTSFKIKTTTPKLLQAQICTHSSTYTYTNSCMAQKTLPPAICLQEAKWSVSYRRGEASQVTLVYNITKYTERWTMLELYHKAGQCTSQSRDMSITEHGSIYHTAVQYISQSRPVYITP